MTRRYFYPRSPCGERPRNTRDCVTLPRFLSTLSLRRATLRRSASIWLDRYFYPRSPCGERQIRDELKSKSNQLFLSTLSLRRATVKMTEKPEERVISIHALLAESDVTMREPAQKKRISIHALLAESDPPVRDIIQWEGIFLSTLSLRRATHGT